MALTLKSMRYFIINDKIVPIVLDPNSTSKQLKSKFINELFKKN